MARDLGWSSRVRGKAGCGRECEDCVESKGVMGADAKARAHLPLELESRCSHLRMLILVAGVWGL